MTHRAVVMGLFFAVTACGASGASSSPPGLCHVGEQTYFSCPTSRGRSINLCGIPGQGVQYRFGRSASIDLEFPTSAADGLKAMFFSHYFRFQTERTEIRFDHQGVRYAIFHDLEAGVRSAGVDVTDGGKESQVMCTGPVVDRLEALQPVLRCDSENALNLGSCP